MLAIRISAGVALLFALLGVVIDLYPVWHGQPLHVHLDLSDIFPVVTVGSLFFGGLLAVLRNYSSLLIAAWSWSLAVQTSGLYQSIVHPHDYSAVIARFGDHQKQAAMRELFERADQFHVRLELFYLTITTIALMLVMIGDLRLRAATRQNAV